jgi:hypothetical protein
VGRPAEEVQRMLVEHPQPVQRLAAQLGLSRQQVMILLRTHRPPVGRLGGLQRIIASYLAAGWTREEAGMELGLAYRGIAHHVVKARILLNAPDEPSLIHRALLSGALPRPLPAPCRELSTEERLMLDRLAGGTGPVRGTRPETLSRLIAALHARTPSHAVALGWATGLLGPAAHRNPPGAPARRAHPAAPPRRLPPPGGHTFLSSTVPRPAVATAAHDTT